MTNEQQVVEATRAAFEDIIDEAPLAPDWASATGRVQRLHHVERQRRSAPVLIGVAAFVFVLVGSLTGLSLVLRGDSGSDTAATATTGATDEPTTTTSTVTPLTTSAAAIEQIDVGLVPAVGPEPRFDTSGLGDEVIPDRGADVTEPAGGTPEERLFRLRSIAQLETVQLQLMSDPDIRAVGRDVLDIGRVADRTGYVLSTVSTRDDVAVCTVIAGESGGANWACMDNSDRLIGFFTESDDRTDNPAINNLDRLEAMYIILNPEVSVMAIEHSTGVKQWQRTYGGAALFVIEGVNSTGSFTVTAYDADGDVMDVGTSEPLGW